MNFRSTFQSLALVNTEQVMLHILQTRHVIKLIGKTSTALIPDASDAITERSPACLDETGLLNPSLPHEVEPTRGRHGDVVSSMARIPLEL